MGGSGYPTQYIIFCICWKIRSYSFIEKDQMYLFQIVLNLSSFYKLKLCYMVDIKISLTALLCFHSYIFEVYPVITQWENSWCIPSNVHHPCSLVVGWKFKWNKWTLQHCFDILYAFNKCPQVQLSRFKALLLVWILQM